jgi:tRNA (cmo5U34)-methyltransferase
MRKNLRKTFDTIAATYDEERKSLIPCFDDFYSIIVELADTKKRVPRILDIGAGTGLLTYFLMEKYPDGVYTLIDIAGEMLSIARNRFAGKKEVIFLNADYAHHDFTETFDIVVSSLSIHHLYDREKEALYKRMYRSLEQGGIFINGDQFKSVSKANERTYRNHWVAYIESSMLSREKKDMAYERMKLDKTATVQKNLHWLEKAGFKDVELFYRYFNFGIIYGRK